MIKKLLRKNKRTAFLLETHFISKKYLKVKGWYQSRYTNIPVDGKGEAIPWYTYPSLYFLEQRVQKDFLVFEYGSGQSTIWFSNRVNKVVSLEHDLAFHEFLKPKLKNLENVDLIYEPLDNDQYSRKILDYESAFDIIVIDGRERVKCAKNSLVALKENGVIIWDNSEREIYQEGYDFLIEKGFKRLDFAGMGPIDHSEWCTSIFYKDNNCLGL